MREKKDTCFICEKNGIEQLQKALHKINFLQSGEECKESAILYSDEWGTTKIILMEREENGVFIYRIGGGKIEIDNDFFGERKIGKLLIE